MLLTIRQTPTEKEWQFFKQLLTDEDTILLAGSACYLMMTPNSLQAQGVIRQSDSQKLGNKADASWQIISDSEWAELIIHSDVNVEW